ncbi:MAG TPA: hypothetical protein VH442_09405 [Micromonosporaceae bacterium]
MTVIRVAPEEVAAYVSRVQRDPSVVSGLLDVEITEWAVRLTAP